MSPDPGKLSVDNHLDNLRDLAPGLSRCRREIAHLRSGVGRRFGVVHYAFQKFVQVIALKVQTMMPLVNSLPLQEAVVENNSHDALRCAEACFRFHQREGLQCPLDRSLGLGDFKQSFLAIALSV